MHREPDSAAAKRRRPHPVRVVETSPLPLHSPSLRPPPVVGASNTKTRIASEDRPVPRTCQSQRERPVPPALLTPALQAGGCSLRNGVADQLLRSPRRRGITTYASDRGKWRQGRPSAGHDQALSPTLGWGRCGARSSEQASEQASTAPTDDTERHTTWFWASFTRPLSRTLSRALGQGMVGATKHECTKGGRAAGGLAANSGADEDSATRRRAYNCNEPRVQTTRARENGEIERCRGGGERRRRSVGRLPAFALDLTSPRRVINSRPPAARSTWLHLFSSLVTGTGTHINTVSGPPSFRSSLLPPPLRACPPAVRVSATNTISSSFSPSHAEGAFSKPRLLAGHWSAPHHVRARVCSSVCSISQHTTRRVKPAPVASGLLLLARVPLLPESSSSDSGNSRHSITYLPASARRSLTGTALACAAAPCRSRPQQLHTCPYLTLASTSTTRHANNIHLTTTTTTTAAAAAVNTRDAPPLLGPSASRRLPSPSPPLRMFASTR
ncbi:hypothetical protein PCL_03896 [Purpureocillium lilacinum]|uniref:Uncharacterized protein n=1 Tax=Purpureocillium lilacinum TaxID=33203 RepID=A0A2U3EQD2_PURLI|nr:hypothetical protein PCL_03896 [Purpureocillium lilacinum]